MSTKSTSGAPGAKTGRNRAKPRSAATARPRFHRGCQLTVEDLRELKAGNHLRLFDRLGAHATHVGRREGVSFAVWAPNASRVSVIGSFNGWDAEQNELEPLGQSGVWSTFVPGVREGMLYKFRVRSREGREVDKADPLAFRCEVPPATASRVWDVTYHWSDEAWMAERGQRSAADAPMSIYELHLGSWKRSELDSRGWPRYRKLADELADYLPRMGFTHVELLPPLEHPFYGSWGYQVTGFFAPSSRYGSPQDLMYLIDRLHQVGVGVILDWVPSHFPGDRHGPGRFDGSRLYEYADPRVGYHRDWKSYVFNYGRPEVQSFLLSSALFWLERYHIDALRVDAVASMLYLDYSRPEGQWIRNKYGGRENLEAIAFLRKLNDEVHRLHPEVKTIAEESTAWPMVSRPTHLGGLGFDMKWDMGWMNDMLEYMRLDPIHRRFHHNKITFRMLYAFSENFVMSLSHDEVVHGKASLLAKMSGDRWQRFANLRLLLGYMYAQPGKKLLFMGVELGQWQEWSHERELDWDLLRFDQHSGLARWVTDLNRWYRDEAALHQTDFEPAGFEWIDCNDSEQSVISFLRWDRERTRPLLIVCNFTPVPRDRYRVGVPAAGTWREVLNGDAAEYGGSGMGNLGAIRSLPMRFHGREHSVELTVPPLGMVVFRHETAAEQLDLPPVVEPPAPAKPQRPRSAGRTQRKKSAQPSAKKPGKTKR